MKKLSIGLILLGTTICMGATHTEKQDKNKCTITISTPDSYDVATKFKVNPKKIFEYLTERLESDHLGYKVNQTLSYNTDGYITHPSFKKTSDFYLGIDIRDQSSQGNWVEVPFGMNELNISIHLHEYIGPNCAYGECHVRRSSEAGAIPRYLLNQSKPIKRQFDYQNTIIGHRRITKIIKRQLEEFVDSMPACTK